jgi:hypothetical protein
MNTKKLYLSVLLTMMTMITVSAQAKNGFYATHFPWDKQFDSILGASASSAASGKLFYYGGPVISKVKGYVVFWGPNVDQETKLKIGDFTANMANSTYLDWLNEYDTNLVAVDGRKGTQQHVSRGSYGGAVTIKPANASMTIDDTDIQAEIQHQIDIGVLVKPDDNTLFMIYFPPGVTITAAGMTSCQDFCAYHGFKGAPDTAHFYFGAMADIKSGMCSIGCGFGSSPFDSLTTISSHEFIEAVTDPFPTPGSNPSYPQAWNTIDGSEIGDVCAKSGNEPLVTPKLSYVVQSEWDNKANACTVGNTWKSQ